MSNVLSGVTSTAVRSGDSQRKMFDDPMSPLSLFEKQVDKLTAD